MALGFNCGQYDQAFVSKKLQNWELPKSYRLRPLAKEGFTEIISNNRGHLLPSIPRTSRSPWGTFVGTWDLPKKLPGNKQANPTARSADAHFRYTSAKEEADVVIKGKNKFRRPKAGQPVEAMTSTLLPSEAPPVQVTETVRSGADNPQAKGTPYHATPTKAASPYLPASNSISEVQNNIESNELAALSSNLTARINAEKQSPIPNIESPHLLFSERRLTPLVTSPKPGSAMQRPGSGAVNH